MSSSQLSVNLLLLTENFLTFLHDLLTIDLHASKAFNDVLEVTDSTLLLEIFDLSPICLWHIVSSLELIISIWEAILTEKSSHIEVSLLHIFVLLINQVLELSFELRLHLSYCWWNDMSQDLVHDWLLFEGILSGGIKFYKILLIRHFDALEISNFFKEH